MRASGVLSQPRGVLAALALGLLLAGCGSAPKPAPDRPSSPRPAPSSDRDGVGTDVPSDLASLPDAEPRIEPIRQGGANKPYTVLGRDYVPITRDSAFSERGLASWYGKKFHGRRTANGETYDMYAMTAAHPTLPLPSYARIRNPANGREVVVRINDRGPFHAGRIVDLSYAAALRLDLLRGVAPVELERLTFDEIRAGNWRRGDAEATRLASAAASRGAPAANAAAADVPLRRFPCPPQPWSRWRRRRPRRPGKRLRPTARPWRRSPRRPWCRPQRRRAASGSSSARFASRPAPRASSGGSAARSSGWCRCSPPSATRACSGSRPAPMPSRADAQGAAARLRDALGLVPVIVERR